MRLKIFLGAVAAAALVATALAQDADRVDQATPPAVDPTVEGGGGSSGVEAEKQPEEPGSGGAAAGTGGDGVGTGGAGGSGRGPLPPGTGPDWGTVPDGHDQRPVPEPE